jgi:FAD/FMN-containing dehydrogenase
MIQGRVLLRGEDDYARTRQIWNGAVEKQPALFAVCETSADVQVAVRVARRHGLPLSVRGGGHDWTGRALCSGLVIDLNRMGEAVVDPRSQVAIVSGGARTKDVDAAAGAHGLVAALGNCGAVGMAGLTMVGGYGRSSTQARPIRWSTGTISTAQPPVFLLRRSLSAYAKSISW